MVEPLAFNVTILLCVVVILVIKNGTLKDQIKDIDAIDNLKQ